MIGGWIYGSRFIETQSGSISGNFIVFSNNFEKKMIDSRIKKIVAPRATGSGKTYLMGALAEQY